VINTDGAGGVVDFSMNDKCAAGTGRFLEVMAGALDTEVGKLGELSSGSEPVEISSMCTVFAESEVISLLAQDVPRERVVAGIHRSVARRVAAMAERLGLGQHIVFTGGVAKNQGVRRALSAALKREIAVHEHCQLAGALGAALLAAEQAGKKA
jgi:predicted CoA-substrate-specific enzyme activase